MLTPIPARGAGKMMSDLKIPAAICTTPFLIGALAFGGCSIGDGSTGARESREAVNPAFEVDEELVKISMSAALLDVALRSSRFSQCKLADSPTSTKSGSEPLSAEQLRERALKNRSRCEVYEAAEKESASTIKEIKARGRLPDRQFVLETHDVVEGDDAPSYYLRSKEIGLFSSLESCERIEKMAYRHFSPTWGCVDWKGIKGIGTRIKGSNQKLEAM